MLSPYLIDIESGVVANNVQCIKAGFAAQVLSKIVGKTNTCFNSLHITAAIPRLSDTAFGNAAYPG
jgi:hypothetical protein